VTLALVSSPLSAPGATPPVDDAAAPGPVPVPAGAPRSRILRRLARHRLGIFSAGLLLLIVLACVAGPWLSPFGANRIDLAARDLGPSLAHWMGTDELGRDQLTRVLEGGRLSLSAGLATMLLTVVLGVAIGATAGYLGGWIDSALMRMVDGFYSIPGLFVLIVAVAMVGVSFWSIVVTLALLNWMATARLIRASVMTLKRQEFVEAAHVLGASHWRVVVRHLIPNALGPILVSATLNVAVAILAESTLSFLGLGFQPPDATWGRMLQEAQIPVIRDGQWWRGFFPGLMIFLTVLCVNFLGDALRDAFDPRTR